MLKKKLLFSVRSSFSLYVKKKYCNMWRIIIQLILAISLFASPGTHARLFFHFLFCIHSFFAIKKFVKLLVGFFSCFLVFCLFVLTLSPKFKKFYCPEIISKLSFNLSSASVFILLILCHNKRCTTVTISTNRSIILLEGDIPKFSIPN